LLFRARSEVALEFSGEVWRHPTVHGWHFVTVPAGVAEAIRERSTPGGFGSVRVRATIGDTTWDTSVFPSSSDPDCYVLPVRAQVRRDEGAEAGALVDVTLVVP
jgi:hypothetical protein